MLEDSLQYQVSAGAMFYHMLHSKPSQHLLIAHQTKPSHTTGAASPAAGQASLSAAQQQDPGVSTVLGSLGELCQERCHLPAHRGSGCPALGREHAHNIGC